MLRDIPSGLSVLVPPVEEPVSLTEAKEHLRVDGNDEDTFIGMLVTTAREYCEGFQRRAYITQTLELTIDRFPSGDSIEMPRPPLQSVVSVKYIDRNGVETTWPDTNYFAAIKGVPGRLVLAYGKRWPSVTLRPAEAITVRFVAGYGSAAAAPQKVKQAMKLLVGHWYEHREAVLTGSISKEIELAVHALLWQDRNF